MLPTSYKCLKCRDEEGTIVRNAEGQEVWKFCECKTDRAIERSFKSSKITLEFQKKSFDSFELADLSEIVRMAYHMARAYVNNFQEVRESKNNSICILGRPGCGKTHLLMAVANELMRNTYKLGGIEKVPSLMYFPWVEGFNEIKDDLSLTEERINRMQKVDVLYIDDMFKGRDKPTPFQKEQLFAVINYRYMEKKPVLISSEYDIDQMCDFDEAIGSRINEMCKDFRIILKGGRELNYRMREGA